jgi:hypothetical protein
MAGDVVNRDRDRRIAGDPAYRLHAYQLAPLELPG